jgi:hypothetical protein
MTPMHAVEIADRHHRAVGRVWHFVKMAVDFQT